MPRAPGQDVTLRWAALFCVALGGLLFYGPYLVRADLFADDVSHHIFWLYRYADPSLFPDDISVTYFQTSAPWGYRAIYAGIAQVFDVLTASQWLAVVLFVLSVYLVWKISAARSMSESELYSLLAVVALIVLLPLSRQKDLIANVAFQRAFALPLLLWTVWGLVSRRYAAVGASWVAAALIYPVVLPVQGLTAAVMFSRDMLVTRRMPPRWLLNGVLGATALALAAFSIPVAPELGPAYTYGQAIQMPEFNLGGRLSLEGGRIVAWLTHHRTGFGWDPEIVLLIGVGFGLAWLFRGAARIPLAVWVMAFVGGGLWAAMRLFPEQLMFDLYLPNRHSRWAAGIFGIFAISAGAAAVLSYAAERWRARSGPAEKRLRLATALIAPLVVTVVLLPHARSVLSQPLDSDLEQVYAFLATLPVSTLVAAHPDLADFIPVRSRRSVLTSTEISMAWMEGYYAQMKPRVEASLRAAYATTIEETDAVLQPFGVDVVVTGPPVWEATTYFAPFDELVGSLWERGAREGFVLQHPPADRILFNSGSYYVVRVSP
jgi:hypothetical protein